MKRILPWLCLVLLSCTKSNPNAVQDGAPNGDGPQQLEGGRPPGTLGGPCLPGDLCNAGLVCQGEICVPEVDGGKWDLGPLDGPRPDRPLIDGPQTPDQTPPCSPVGYKAAQILDDKGGDWRVVIEPQTQAKTLGVAGAKPKQAAAVFDHNLAGDQVAGFVVSRPSQYSTAVQEATAAIQDLKQNLTNVVVSVRNQGSQGSSHDGFDAVMGLTLDLKLVSSNNIALVRRPIVAGLLQVPLASLSGVPPAFGAPDTAFVVRLGLVMRKDKRVVFIGAVTSATTDGDSAHLSQALSDDLGSTNLLGQEGASLGPLCDSQTVTTKPKNDVDIIWVMDESGSMDSKRTAIAQSAASFFTQLQQTGLDFRMGVTNVCDPGGSYSAAVGKFCSKISAVQSDMGGTDRFLLPSEQAIFSACINNPPGYEPSQEYGLANAMKAVSLHLPRAANDPTRIRTDAQVVIIVVTDEAPQGLKNIFPSSTNVFSQCTFNANDQNKVNTFVQPYIDYFKGTSDAQAKVDYFQVVAGTCSSTGPGCSYPPDVAHGYSEVAAQLAGQVYNVCQSNLSAAISTIIGGIVTTASTFLLKQVPVASSLSVSVDGSTLVRSTVSGFRHTAGTQELQFVGSTTVNLGSTVIGSYRTW